MGIALQSRVRLRFGRSWVEHRRPDETATPARAAPAASAGLRALAIAALLTSSVPALTAAEPPRATVKGTASYRERIALSPDAVFEATLQNVPRGNEGVEVIAQTRRSNPGQVPIAFEITYDPLRIDPARTYIVRATIFEKGQPRFRSDWTHTVLTHGRGSQVTIALTSVPGGEPDRSTGTGGNRPVPPPAPVPPLGNLPATFSGLLPCADCQGIRVHLNLLPHGAFMRRMSYLRNGHDDAYYEVGTWSLSNDGKTLTLDGDRGENSYWTLKNPRTLRKLDREGKPIDSKLPYELTRQSGVETIEPRVTLTGMFRYRADAARFRDCRSGLEWPVATGNDYLALEREYTSRHLSGSELKVTLEGRVESRPRMEGNGAEPALVVEKFVKSLPGETCAGKNDGAGLANNRWRPVRVGGRTVTVAEGQQEPWMVLDPKAKHVTGSGGCNRFSGSYQAGDGTLRFGHVAATQMACPAMEVESAFLRALGATRRYRIDGRILELLDEHRTALARLEERNLK